MRVTSFVLAFILLLSAKVVAQTSCEATLTNAQAEFDAGRFHAVPALLKECLEKEQNRKWQERAHLLLAETYLLLEDAEMADQSFLNVLKANPEFETDEKRDPIDLVYLSKKFTSTPIFSVNTRLGLNASFIRVINDYKAAPQRNPSENYSYEFGWQAGIGGSYHYNQNWSAGIEVNYQVTSFEHITKGMFLDANNILVFRGRQNWLNIPLLFRFDTGAKGLRPYVFGGYAANLLLRDHSDLVMDGDTESPNYSYGYKRKSFTSSVIAGGGLKYKWGLRYLFGEVRYSVGLNNLALQDTRVDAVNFEWPYVNDDVRMDNLYVSVGYIHPFYKPRKVAKPKTKSVLRKTRKSYEDK